MNGSRGQALTLHGAMELGGLQTIEKKHPKALYECLTPWTLNSSVFKASVRNAS